MGGIREMQKNNDDKVKDSAKDMEQSKNKTRVKTMKALERDRATSESLTVEATSKITSKGQITVPVEIRNVLNVKVGDQLRFIFENGTVYIEPIKILSADELFGIFNQSEDNGEFVLDLNTAREYRANQILTKYQDDFGR